MTSRNDEVLTAAECAERLGLTVRALRVYERLGLIKPGRTQKNWRLYGTADIARLHEVMALKQLGLSLARIADLLAGRATDLHRTLSMQEVALTELRDRAGRSLALVATLRARLASEGRLSIDELVHLARETNMNPELSDAVAWRRYEQARPRTEVGIDPALLADYAGSYLFADGTTYVVTIRGGRLFVRVMGQPEVEAFAEAEDRFFLKVVPAQITFQRGGDGAVASLIHHQSGYDQEAARVEEAVVRDAEAALADRIRSRMPLPGGEAILRRVIAEHRRGEPDYDAMIPPLADLVREQLPMIGNELSGRGEPREVSFKGVGPSGIDVYEVRFDESVLEWGLALAPDGRIASLYFRPVP